MLGKSFQASAAINSQEELMKATIGVFNRDTKRSPYTYKFHNVTDIRRFMRNQFKSNAVPLMEQTRRQYLINCSNVNEIKIGKLLGHGKYKSAYIGTFRGIKVALKVVTRRIGKSSSCAKFTLDKVAKASLSGIKNALLFSKCKRNAPVESMVYEIINHAALDFPNIVRMLGYCVRDEDAMTNVSDDGILSQGLITVFEFSEPFCLNKLSNLPWLEKIYHCRDMANLLEMSEQSLVGSIAYTDMHDRHFMVANGIIKIIDLDTYVTSVETKCGAISKIPFRNRMERRKRQRYSYSCLALPSNVSCVNSRCLGGNAKGNLFTFTKFFFSRVLDYERIPPYILEIIQPFLDDMNDLNLTATELRTGFDLLLTGNLTLYSQVWGNRTKTTDMFELDTSEQYGTEEG